MHSDYHIRQARPEEIRRLGAIEKAASVLFRDVGLDGPFLDETTSTEDLAAAQADDQLWVVLHASGCVGFAMAGRLSDGTAWLEEVDVHPDHARRGIGRALVEEVIAWAQRQGSASLGLTTFRDVAWNAPFYRTLGFREIEPTRYSAAIQRIVEDELRRGLPKARRTVMLLQLANDPNQA